MLSMFCRGLVHLAAILGAIQVLRSVWLGTPTYQHLYSSVTGGLGGAHGLLFVSSQQDPFGLYSWLHSDVLEQSARYLRG